MQENVMLWSFPPLSFLFIMEFWWPINGVRWKRALRADTIGHQWTHEKEREALEQENFLYVTGYLMAGSWESSSKAFGPAINRLQENSQGFQLPGLKKRKSFTLIAHSFLLLWGDRERFLFNHGKLRTSVTSCELAWHVKFQSFVFIFSLESSFLNPLLTIPIKRKLRKRRLKLMSAIIIGSGIKEFSISFLPPISSLGHNF